ncbi:MAG: glycosyltransferase family 2 protein [Acidipila sp.]|nr:glycosyltransferase family 2 protein [Acidipila sp.]
MAVPRLKISIVIPSFNEERRLPNTLERIRAYLAARPFDAEVIVVDDGSTDGTARVVEEFRATMPTLRLLSNGSNRGKGYSVRQGMLQARGDMALFTDADLSAPIEEADKLIGALQYVDVTMGSRALDRSLISERQSRFREFAGIVFNKLVKLTLGLPFVDTQCGFKAFGVGRTRIIFEQQRVERFGFDPELLFLAKLHGLRALEIPVRWSHNPETKVRVGVDSARMFGELLVIRWNWLLGRYPRRPANAAR